MSASFRPVWYHRFKYFLTPQFDLYRNIADAYPDAMYVLDYGCGTGFGLLAFCERESKRVIWGIDSDPNAVDFAKIIFNKLIDFAVADWCIEEPSIFNSADLITCVEVLEHASNPTLLLRRLRDRILPDGILIISTLNHNSQYRKNNDHIARYTVSGFRALLTHIFRHEVKAEKPFEREYSIHITDFTLREVLRDNSSITPMVGVIKRLDNGKMDGKAQEV